MVKEFISHWLEEGFSNYDKSTQYENAESTVNPLVTNKSRVNNNPKPLFPVFLNEVELESSFLNEYLEIIQEGLSRGKKVSKEAFSTTKNIAANQSTGINKNVVDIDYDRKNIFLSSKIFPLFEIADTYISNWSSEYQSVLSLNNDYKKTLEYRQKCPLNFHEESTLIGNFNVSDKQIETTPIILEDKSFLVNAYLMGKHYSRNEVYVKPAPKTFQQYLKSRTKFRDVKEFHCKLSDYPEILERLKKNIYVIEKNLDYNTNECTITLFNSLSNPTELNNSSLHTSLDFEQSGCLTTSKSKAYMRLQFYLPVLKNKYQVSCIECHPLNPSIFICGYSMLPDEEMSHEPKGIVLCWNINKCGYPERIYRFDEAVMNIDISNYKPYLIAVGMLCGLIAVVDLRQPDSHSYVTNRACKDRPLCSIKSVRWIVKKFSLNKDVEILLSVSVDGIVTSWTYEKLLKGNIVTTIRKQVAEQEKNKQFYISNTTFCMCMDLNPDDDNVFAVGTSEGKVFILNVNNPEDIITQKDCHFGSVNCIKWSTLTKNIFFTSGTDRCLHIWELDNIKPFKTLILSNNVLGISLSSINSSLFSAITKHKLYIYDLAVNLHKPIVEIDSGDKIFSSVKFCPHNDWLFVGQSDGKVTLFEITDIVNKLKSIESDALRNIFLTSKMSV